MSEETAKNEVIQKTDKKRNLVLTMLSFIFLIAGGVWILSLFFDFRNFETTNNAQVDAYMNNIAARATGRIQEIKFEANQLVHQGDTLVILNSEEYVIKVKQAAADLAIAEGNLHSLEQNIATSSSKEAASKARLSGEYADVEKANKDYERFRNMFADSAVTKNQYDQVLSRKKSAEANLIAAQNELLASGSVTKQSETNLEAARATVARKLADLDAANLQLSYTIITAPIDGFVGERTLSVGDLVNTNQVVASIVLKEKIWVTANFKETQVARIKVGQKVTIAIDALGDKKFKGKVVGFSPATGAKFSMVQPDNSTGNFVKITQRIPVKIEFEDTSESLAAVKPGMNVTVEVNKK